MTDYDGMDVEDYRILLQNILRQATEDYVKLQHPKYRKKKYLQEAFEDAVDMLFDPSYRFSLLKNEIEQDMSLVDFLCDMVDSNRVKISNLQQFVIDEAKQYWKEKPMNTINIPDMFCIEGEVYDICHEDIETYYFDYDKKELYINKHQTDENEEQFVMAIAEALCYHLELKISKRTREEFSKGLYRALKVNDALR